MLQSCEFRMTDGAITDSSAAAFGGAGALLSRTSIVALRCVVPCMLSSVPVASVLPFRVFYFHCHCPSSFLTPFLCPSATNMLARGVV